PSAALPKDVSRFSKQIVFDRAVQVAEAGMRVSLHEPVPDSAAQLEMDFIGSDFSRLANLTTPGDLPFVQHDVTAFDELRRRSVRGDVFAAAVGRLLAPEVSGQGAAGFHQAFAEKVSYRPAHLSVLLTTAAGALPYTATLVDAQGRRVGGQDSAGKFVKEIPFGDLVPLVDGTGATTGQMIILAAPDAGEFHLRFDPVSGVPTDGAFTVSLVVPDGSGGLRQVVYSGLTAANAASSPFATTDPFRVLLDLPVGGGTSPSVSPAIDTAILPPLPQVLGVVQQANKDILSCDFPEAGRIIAVLFSEEVTPAGVQDRVAAADLTRYAIDNNKVMGVALQPGRRVAFLALRDPVGPFVPRQLSLSGIVDGHGRAMTTQSVPIETTVTSDGAVVSGQVLGADGLPVPFANVRLLVSNGCPALEGISAKSADADGRFSWDWVPNTVRNRIAAVSPGADDGRAVDFTSQRNGQRLNVNIVFLGRGTLTGRTLAEDGTPLVGSNVKVTSLTDQSSYGAKTDEHGQFAIPRIPVGNVLLEAVHVPTNAKGSAAELIPLAGASVARDMTLFSVTFPTITVKFGTVTGHVLRADGRSPVADVPVIAYYRNETQPGVRCPGLAGECAVAVSRTDASGAFTIDHISAGHIHLVTFDELTFQQGSALVTLPILPASDGSVDATILLAQGLGTVNGTVLDASGRPVPNARVGGGLSLSTADADGHFVLTDVPVGRHDIVAVSDQLGTRGTSAIDIVQAGQVVNVTIVLEAVGTIAGTVFRADGVTPVPNTNVYLFYLAEGGGDGAQILVVATAKTDAGGHYTMEKVVLRQEGYTLSAFKPDFSEGNVRPALLKFNNQVLRGDIVFRGGGGVVTGRVLDADGTTPLRAAVGITGDQVAVAGGLVGTGFQSVTNYQIVNSDFTTGAFRFNNVFVGDFTLTAAGQFSPDPISVLSAIPTPGATVQLDLKLQATSQIQGTVFQPDGVTPAGPNVIVRYRSAAFKQVCAGSSGMNVGGIAIEAGTCKDVPQGIQDETQITDDDGHYVLPLVNAGAFTLTADDPGTGRTAQIAGTIRPGETGDFSIRLLGVSTLTINVRGSDSTTPIPNAAIEVKQLAYPKKTFRGAAGISGTLVLDGGDAFTEGDVVVMATDPANGFAGRATGRVTSDGGNVTINVFLFNASGTVSGTVFAPDGLTPVPNAEVVISNCVEEPFFIGVGAAPCISGGPLVFAVTDSTGRYRQDLIPLGPFRVDVFEAATARLGFASGSVDFNQQQVPVDVTQFGRGLVTGTVFAAQTLAPLKNWEVAITQVLPSGRSLPQLRAASGVDGTFSFPGVTVGRVFVAVSKQPLRPGDPFGSRQVETSVSTEGQHVDVPIVVEVIEPHHGVVEGVVVNPDGTPAANVAVDFCAVANCSSLSASGHIGALTAADGSFRFEQVLIGRFTISAKSQVSLNAATAEGQLLFEGDLARVTLVLVGLKQVSGSVVFANNQPAPNVRVLLHGIPSSGCNTIGGCIAFTDANGAFAFLDVPANTYDLTATDPVSGLSGIVTGALNPGDHPVVRMVLQATSSVSGRVLLASGLPAARVTAELVQTGTLTPLHIFQVTDDSGRFTFPAVPVASFTLTLTDPIGPGVARRAVQTGNTVNLGDIVLDEAPPSVTTLTPQASSVGIARNTTVRIVFSEPVSQGSVNQTNVRLTDPTGPVLGTLAVVDGDTTAVFTPLGPLAEQTRYTLTVQSITDLIGKAMPVPYTASFTTVDLTPPSVTELTPGNAGSGIALSTVVRVKYSEPVDPARFRGPPVTLTKGAAVVAGRTDFILGNTAVVFTPTLPLDENASYQLQVGPATDLSGNEQAAALTASFSTLDRTPPQVVALHAAGDGTVIENGITTVTADVGSGHDISVVDFFINDQPATAARTAPFTLALQAVAALGQPGAQIKVSAFATDTSGNRSLTPAVTFLPIVADRPPVVTITGPADGAAFRTGERVTVLVHVADDLGATQVGYRAQTGKPQDAATQTVAPASLDLTRTFAFTISADAIPGSSVAINATGVD
ncbi:MAG: carboxypeptidase regulatory-like domain-containing protein, partial [Vicinamibacterales bacterium]